MDVLLSFLGSLPAAILVVVLTLALFGGMIYIIYLLIHQGRVSNTAMATLQDNHLHDLPEIVETLRRIERQQGASMAAILGQLSDIRVSLATIIARANGK